MDKKRIQSKKITVWFEPEFLEKFKEACEKDHRSLSATIRMLIEEYLERRQNKN